MMIRFFPFLFFIILFINDNKLFCKEAPGGYGIVVVHEAPLFLKPDKTTTVVDRLRKNDKIYIHRKHLLYYEDIHNKITSSDSYLTPDVQIYNKHRSKISFYTTVDRNGNTAYIPKEYVKLIFNDHRESVHPLPSEKEDTTDYRLVEPLHKNFPFFISNNMSRTAVSFTLSMQNTQSYNYPSAIAQKNEKIPFGLDIIYSLPVNWMQTDDLFLGGILGLSYQQSNYFLNNEMESSERRWQLSLGPLILKDTFRKPSFQLSCFVSPLLYLWDQNDLQQEGSLGTEARSFSQVHFGLKAGLYYQQLDFLGEYNDPTLGFALLWIPAHHPSSGNNQNKPLLWNDRGSYRKNSEVAFQFFIGTQIRPY